MVLSWSTATWCTSMSSSLTSSTYASSRSNWRLSARYDTRPWRWSMAIAWFRISSKVIATLPTPRRRAQDGVGMGKVGWARYTADGGQKKAAGLAARPGGVPRCAPTWRGHESRVAPSPMRHALAQLLRRPPRVPVRALLSARDHDPLQKGENRTRRAGSTDAQPSVLAPRVLDPEEVHRESRSFRVLLGRVQGQPCTESVRRLPSATNMGNPLQPRPR